MSDNIRIVFDRVLVRLDDDTVIRVMKRRQLTAMNIIGGTVRKIARQSIKKANKRRVQYFHSNTGERLSKAKGIEAVEKGYGYQKRVRKPGVANKPPRYHTRGQCSLKDGIFYGVEDVGDPSVAIGAILCTRRKQGGKTIPQALEEGSSENRPFPFMAPALERAIELDKVTKAVETLS